MSNSTPITNGATPNGLTNGNHDPPAPVIPAEEHQSLRDAAMRDFESAIHLMVKANHLDDAVTLSELETERFSADQVDDPRDTAMRDMVSVCRSLARAQEQDGKHVHGSYYRGSSYANAMRSRSQSCGSCGAGLHGRGVHAGHEGSGGCLEREREPESRRELRRRY